MASWYSGVSTPGRSGNNNPVRESVADFTFALLLAVTRKIIPGDKMMREGRFHGWSPMLLLGHDVYEKTLGIIGLGRIGNAVIKRAKGFNMKILYYDVQRNKELEKSEGIKFTPLEDLLQKSDFVSVHAPARRTGV